MVAKTMVTKTMITKTMAAGDGQRVEGRRRFNCTKSGHPAPDRSVPQPKTGAKYEH
jgi:hypothetical protein